MKFMLLMHYGGNHCAPIHTWSPEEIQAHIAFMIGFNEKLQASGELVDAQGLTGPESAKIVNARRGAPPLVTDGPFPETKEFLAGYWIVQCENEARAIEIAATASAAPGPKGEPMSIPIEVRSIGAPPDANT